LSHDLKSRALESPFRTTFFTKSARSKKLLIRHPPSTEKIPLSICMGVKTAVYVALHSSFYSLSGAINQQANFRYFITTWGR
jgi:hypothetical protein